MLFTLDICVNKKAPPTHSVHWGINPSPPQQAVVIFSVSEETKFEVDTTSISLSYLYHLWNVIKNYLNTINLHMTKLITCS